MRPILALLLVAVSLLAAACGEDAKEEYEGDVRDIGEQLQDSSVGNQLQNVRTPQQLATALGGAADLLDSAAAELDELDPPDEVAGAHEKVTEGARETADAFRQVAEKAKSGNPKEVVTTITELTSSGGAAKLEEGLKELEDKGYNVRDEDE